MIKALIFDFGNVVCHFTNEILIERISQISNKSKEEVFEMIYKVSGLPKKYETGLIDSKEFFRELSKLFSINVSYEELKTIYSKNKFTPVEGMENLIKRLQKNYKIGLLSNCSEWDFDYMIKTAPIIQTFDCQTKSYEVKAMKPDPKIFLDALNKLELEAKECVYTDDILEYVEEAKSLGFVAVQFTDTKNFESFIKSQSVLGLTS